MRELRKLLSDRYGVAAIEFAVVLPVMIIILLPITDIALAALRQIEAYQAMRGLAAYAQYHPPQDVTQASAWSQSLPNIPGYTINAAVICNGSPCASNNTASPKWFSFSTTVTVTPIFWDVCGNGCNLVHAERFQ